MNQSSLSALLLLPAAAPLQCRTDRLVRVRRTRLGLAGTLWLGVIVTALMSPARGASGGPALVGLPQRPADTPDIMLLEFSGLLTGVGPIASSGLHALSGMQLLVNAFHDLGQSVRWRDYAASMGHQHDSPFSETMEQGLEQAIRDVEWIKANWQDGYANPTRLVLISNSGGGGSMHLLPFVFPDAQFDYMIDIDTACVGLTLQYLSWWLTTPPWKRVYLRQHLHEIPRRLMPWILGVPAPCAVGPRHPQTINNLVADNVVYNLDTRTALLSSARIITPTPVGGPIIHSLLGIEVPLPLMTASALGIAFNRRPGLPDGTPHRGEKAGIYRYVDTTSFHGSFQYESDGARWAAGKILELGLPPWQPPQVAPPAGMLPELQETMVTGWGAALPPFAIAQGMSPMDWSRPQQAGIRQQASTPRPTIPNTP